MNDVYIKLGLTVLIAGAIGFYMLKLQKRKEKEADEKFDQTMKLHGLSTEVEEPKHIMMHAEVAVAELDEAERIPAMELPNIEVRDEKFDLKDLGKVKRKKRVSKKVTKKKKKVTKRK